MSNGYFVELNADARQERDGSHTVVLELSGLPSIEQANKILVWLHTVIKENVSVIGRLAPDSKQ